MNIENEFKLLVVDDEPDALKAMGRFLARTDYKLIFSDNGSKALDILSKESVSLVLLDLKMPGMDGFTVLKAALEKQPDLKVIILTGHGGVQEAVKALTMGAVDFFEKPISPKVLRQRISQIYSIWQLKQENQMLRSRIAGQFQFDELVGESPSMLKLKDMISRIAPTDSSILIQGESGTGKELVARAIHYHSNRESEVFMPVDCAAITESVMESELFGHAKGAFTGANQASLGLIRSADRGTLFLDEVGELSMNMQAKLLRTIQERTVRPVGSMNLKPVDIRIVAATNRDLMKATEEGSFRLDLYYRLSAITLVVPPLHERYEDIPMLARHIAGKLKNEGLPPKRFSKEALTLLSNYNWPGNVRELENVIRRAMAFAVTDTISPKDLESISETATEVSSPNPSSAATLSDYEANAIRSTLEQTGGNRRKAAEILGISEATLYRRIKEYNI